jgi:hypothetical protein
MTCVCVCLSVCAQAITAHCHSTHTRPLLLLRLLRAAPDTIEEVARADLIRLVKAAAQIEAAKHFITDDSGTHAKHTTHAYTYTTHTYIHTETCTETHTHHTTPHHTSARRAPDVTGTHKRHHASMRRHDAMRLCLTSCLHMWPGVCCVSPPPDWELVVNKGPEFQVLYQHNPQTTVHCFKGRALLEAPIEVRAALTIRVYAHTKALGILRVLAHWESKLSS